MVLIGAMNMRRHLQAGITTLREHGARNRIGFTLKEGLRRGYIPGPRMLVSGRPITCTGGHFHMCNEVADGEEEIRRSVRRLVHEGADYIKGDGLRRRHDRHHPRNRHLLDPRAAGPWSGRRASFTASPRPTAAPRSRWCGPSRPAST